MHRRIVNIPQHHGKKKLLREFNEIHRCHATYCMIKMIKTTNNEMFKEFVLSELNK